MKANGYEIKGGANLREANLREANLRGANLYGADLREADLREANLRGVNLYGANLYGANLYGADLRGADLRGADLREANLRGANLYGANLRGANLPDFQLPAGDLIVFKKLNGRHIATLRIASHVKRTASLVGRKCRAEAAEVLAITPHVQECESERGGIYRVGETVFPDKYDDDPAVECTHGIHFFLTKKEAEQW